MMTVKGTINTQSTTVHIRKLQIGTSMKNQNTSKNTDPT